MRHFLEYYFKSKLRILATSNLQYIRKYKLKISYFTVDLNYKFHNLLSLFKYVILNLLIDIFE